MNVVTVQQPAASLIIAGATSVLSHSWAAPFEIFDTRLAIHAGSRKPRPTTWTLDVQETVVRLGGILPTGAVLGSASLLDVLEIIEDLDYPNSVTARSLSSYQELTLTPRSLADYSQGRFLWLFADVHQLPNPVPIAGREGIWVLPREVNMACRRELQAAG